MWRVEALDEVVPSARAHRWFSRRPERHRTHHFFFVDGHKAVVKHDRRELVEFPKLVIEKIRPFCRRHCVSRSEGCSR